MPHNHLTALAVIPKGGSLKTAEFAGMDAGKLEFFREIFSRGSFFELMYVTVKNELMQINMSL